MKSPFCCPGTPVLFLLCLPRIIRAAVSCNKTHNPCEDLLWPGSKCRNGFCTNPFEQGCLRSILQDEEYEELYNGIHNDESQEQGIATLAQLFRRAKSSLRMCNSEDDPDAAKKGLCLENTNESNFEVRIHSQNWESAMATAWILQILFSELLQVPATIETGDADAKLNFYDTFNAFDYGDVANSYWFQSAYDAEGGDCTVYRQGESYTPCAHFAPEVWHLDSIFIKQEKAGVAETAEFTGAIAIEGWYVTKHTLEKDPSLATHFGMQGEENRRKLAETFKRPATWKQYCEEVSEDGCATPDKVAKRAPAADGSEDYRYFAEGEFTGHFRATEKNDCNKTKLCTGHIADYPCEWTSFIRPQTRHLNISLVSEGREFSGGYTYEQMVELWAAANATKSNFISLWWQPDVVFTIYEGTYTELTKVLMPTPSQECVENRVDLDKRCDETATDFDIYGGPKGACGQPPIGLMKAVVGNLYSIIYGSNTPEALRSPAYEVMKKFKMGELYLLDILNDWHYRGHDKWNFDLRFATCKWMADHLKQLESYIPKTYPREFVTDATKTPLHIASLVFGAIAIVITFATIAGVAYRQQYKRQGVNNVSQIEFVMLLLAGLSLVSVGSLLLAVHPSNGSCISSIWMVTLGYTLQLIPLIIKVAAIVTILEASKKMRRIVVDKNILLAKSFGLSAITAIYCLIWTILDPPLPHQDYRLTDELNELGETIVTVTYFCTSKSNWWYYASYVWQSLLLVAASVLAFQIRSAPRGINDSSSLATMIYSSFLFLILRIVTYVLAGTMSNDSFSEASLSQARSLLISLDTIANIIIYFPKILSPNHSSATERLSRFSSLRSILENTVRAEIRRQTTNGSIKDEEKAQRAPSCVSSNHTTSGYCEQCPHCQRQKKTIGFERDCTIIGDNGASAPENKETAVGPKNENTSLRGSILKGTW